MIKSKLFILVILLISAFTTKSFAQNDLNLQFDYSSLNSADGKIYFSADQLIISDQGIFALLEDANELLLKVFVPQLNYDENGLYILADQIFLPEVHKDGAVWVNIEASVTDVEDVVYPVALALANVKDSSGP